MAVSQGPNWGCSAKEKKNKFGKDYELSSIAQYLNSAIFSKSFRCLYIIILSSILTTRHENILTSLYSLNILDRVLSMTVG
jgi:hypothetical protein